jgi:hypothetical protein
LELYNYSFSGQGESYTIEIEDARSCTDMIVLRHKIRGLCGNQGGRI